MADPTAEIRLKVERAKEHIRNLQIEITAFLKTNPYKIGTKQNSQTRQLIYYVSSVEEIPSHIALITGDVLQNLRSSLDHLAWRLVEANGQRPTRDTAFPIYDDAAKYKTGYLRQVKGMSGAAINAIDGIKPYQGGNDTIWRLHRLNNIDKHRIVITVGSAFHSVDLGAHMFARMAEMVPALANTEPLHAFFRGADRLFPLKTGDELLIDAPDAKVNEKMQFAFDVAFGEPQILEGGPLIETLQEFAEVVDKLILSFILLSRGTWMPPGNRHKNSIICLKVGAFGG